MHRLPSIARPGLKCLRLVPRPLPPVVLLAFANVDNRRPLRNLEREEAAIETALRPLATEGKLELKTLWNATAKRIVSLFQDEHFHGRIRVFHFGGHASSDDITLADIHGDPVATSAVSLGNYLGHQPGLSLVFLNGCSTEAQVQRLWDAGIEAVISTSRAIDDQAASDFARYFYAESRHYPLREAFDLAGTATRMTDGRHARALFAEGTAEIDQLTPPWRLQCRDEHWRLAPTQIPRIASNPDPDPASDRQVVDALIDTVTDEDLAKILLHQVGFPPGRTPSFPNAYVFWSKVTAEIRRGTPPGRLQPLVDAAAELFPYNAIFARYRS